MKSETEQFEIPLPPGEPAPHKALVEARLKRDTLVGRLKADGVDAAGVELVGSLGTHWGMTFIRLRQNHTLAIGAALEELVTLAGAVQREEAEELERLKKKAAREAAKKKPEATTA